METHPQAVRPSSDRYLELVRQFPLRPLHSEAELDSAVKVINSLLDRDQLDADEDDYLDVLSDLVEKYEFLHHPIESVSDAEMLRHLIEARNLSQAQVATDTGISESTISEVLAGKRGLSRRNVGLLARFFRVSPAVFSFD